jgi:hypothetical protein
MATSKFGRAFAEARKAGKKVFSFNGKSYNTKLKEDSGTPTPTPRPARAADTAKSGASQSVSGKAKGAQSGASRSTEGKGAPEVGIAKAGSPIARAAARQNPQSREKQDYPRGPKDVGIAKKGSKISLAASRRENKAVPKKKP